MNGSSTWGQALDYRHKVKAHVRDWPAASGHGAGSLHRHG